MLPDSPALRDSLRSYPLLLLLHSFLAEDPDPRVIRTVIAERNELAYRMLRGSLAVLPDHELLALEMGIPPASEWEDDLAAHVEVFRTRLRAIRAEVRRRRSTGGECPSPDVLEQDARLAVQTWIRTWHPTEDLFRYLRGR